MNKKVIEPKKKKTTEKKSKFSQELLGNIKKGESKLANIAKDA